jgi:hypothetical protein
MKGAAACLENLVWFVYSWSVQTKQGNRSVQTTITTCSAEVMFFDETMSYLVGFLVLGAIL